MSFFEELHNHFLHELDLSHYCEVSPRDSVASVIETMQTTNQNCALVVEQGRLAGIFTDRDVLLKVATQSEATQQPIQNVMTADPITARTDYSIAMALKVMDEHHIRNLPVLAADGSLVGNFTHHAFIRYLADHFPTDIYNRPAPSTPTSQSRYGA